MQHGLLDGDKSRGVPLELGCNPKDRGGLVFQRLVYGLRNAAAVGEKEGISQKPTRGLLKKSLNKQ